MAIAADPSKQITAKSSVCGVRVSTWGSHPGAGNGLLHFLDFTLFGGNVGHASVAVTFPATEESKKLIEKYCNNPDPYKPNAPPIIPYVKKKVVIPHSGKTEEVYEVYFSWWPKRLHDASKDAVEEWAGVEFEWSPEWAERIKPERRKYGGILGNRILTLGPKSIVHQRAMTAEQYEELNIRAKLEIDSGKLKSLKILSDKLDAIDNAIRAEKSRGLSVSEILLLDNLVPDWKNKTQLANQAKLSPSDVTKLKESVLEVEKLIVKEKAEADIKLQHTQSAEKITLLKKQEATWDFALQDANYFRDFLLLHKDKGLEKNPEALDKYKKLVVNLDKKFKWDEKQKRIINAENMNPATLQSVLEIINTNILDAKNNKQKSIDEQQATLKDAEERLENWIKGRPPDNVVSLPISSTMEGGLDVEKMLAEMQKLTQKDFNLYTNNCSKTVGAILEAGAQNRPDLQDYFKSKAYGFFGNPQEVYNNAIKFQSALLLGEKPSKIKSLMRYNPFRSGGALEKLGGTLIGILMEGLLEGNPLRKVGAFLAGLIVAPLALANFLVKKVFNPLDSFKGLMGLGAFAFSRNSIVIKAVGVVCYVLAAAFAVPAVLQAGILKFVDAVSNRSSDNQKQGKRRKEQESAIEKEKFDKLPESERQKLIKEKELQKAFDARVAKAVISRMVEIAQLDPKEALKVFKLKLDEDPYTIPHLSKQSEQKMREYLSNKETPISERTIYHNLWAESVKRVKNLESKVRLEPTSVTPATPATPVAPVTPTMSAKQDASISTAQVTATTAETRLKAAINTLADRKKSKEVSAEKPIKKKSVGTQTQPRHAHASTLPESPAVNPSYQHILHPGTPVTRTPTETKTSATNSAPIEQVRVKLQKGLDKISMGAGSSLGLKLLFDSKKIELVHVGKPLATATATKTTVAKPVPKVIMTVTETEDKTKFRFDEKPTKTIAELALDAAEPPIVLSSCSISDIQLFGATASASSPPKLLRFDEPTITLIQSTTTLKNDPHVKAILAAQKMDTSIPEPRHQGYGPEEEE